jgi:sigma-70-like protein
MASLDTLPGDQRAVLELVVRRGRSYEEIERLLSIDRTAVRARALAALDAIGPPTSVPAPRRALLADYLLGQLPPRLSAEVRDRLSDSPEERAWARAIASELAPVAAAPLPEIPSESVPAREPPSPSTPPSAPPGSAPPERPTSRLGGAVLLGVGALVAIAVAVFLLTRPGADHRASTNAHVTKSSTAAAVPSTGTAGATATTGTNTAKVIGQILLSHPGGKGKAKGAAAVVAVGTSKVIELAAYGLAPNKHNAYAVWLYNSPTDEYRIGYYTPGVGSDGRLLTRGVLPASAAHYKQLLLALEPEPAPNKPTTIVLAGALGIR